MVNLRIGHLPVLKDHQIIWVRTGILSSLLPCLKKLGHNIRRRGICSISKNWFNFSAQDLYCLSQAPSSVELVQRLHNLFHHRGVLTISQLTLSKPNSNTKERKPVYVAATWRPQLCLCIFWISTSIACNCLCVV